MKTKIHRDMSKKDVFRDRITDLTTGEVVAERVISRIKLKTEERFIKTYLDDLGALIKCTNAEKNFILSCIRFGYIGYENNEIWLDKTRKEEIAKDCGTNLKSVHNCLYRLLSKNLIIRHQGKKLLNPKLFFTGDERSRNKMFELKIKYTL